MPETKATQELTDADFDQVVNSGKPVFVDFWAGWCGPCLIIAPIIEELATAYEGRAVVGKFNCDENPMIAQRFGVTSLPTMMMFKGGKLVDRMVGAAPRGTLQAFIDRNL